jgi:hypothetical protein
LGSIYGFLQGAWPFGLVEAAWAGVAVYRWRARIQNVEGLEHDPEKWNPVFRKDHAQTKS